MVLFSTVLRQVKSTEATIHDQKPNNLHVNKRWYWLLMKIVLPVNVLSLCNTSNLLVCVEQNTCLCQVLLSKTSICLTAQTLSCTSKSSSVQTNMQHLMSYCCCISGIEIFASYGLHIVITLFLDHQLTWHWLFVETVLNNGDMFSYFFANFIYILWQGFYQSSLDVKQIDVPTGTGYIGILESHVPTFGVLKPGVMTVIEHSGTANKYFGMYFGCEFWEMVKTIVFKSSTWFYSNLQFFRWFVSYNFAKLPYLFFCPTLELYTSLTLDQCPPRLTV